ncbi:MAG: NAD(P)H-binding protein [Chitinophagaceae bacterium]|nr:NAD(P)H-binding protein [Chitinophagaceae bacterium]
MKIIVTGATGTVGSEVVRQAVLDDSIEQVTLLARNRSDLVHPKIRQIIHKDFLNYNGLEDVFRESDACIWCLGISQTRVSKQDYFIITYEYAVAAANAMLLANPQITFLFLSGEGADSTEKSRVRFARVKGQTENALKAMNFNKLIIFRPGGIYPVVRNANETTYKKMEIGFIKLMKFFAPFSVVNTDVLARAMLKSLVKCNGKMMVGHRAIRQV